MGNHAFHVNFISNFRCCILKPFASTEILIRFTGAILTISQLIEIYDDIYVLNQVGKAEKIIEEETK